MSREIKFRIWDDFKYEWLGKSDNDSLTFYGFHLVGEVMSVQCPPQWALDPCCTVEQYTGLKDKNGKEIYDGILLDYMGKSFFIKWSENAFAFIAKGEKEYYWLDKSKSECEIVGNVHENSQLLGGGGINNDN